MPKSKKTKTFDVLDIQNMDDVCGDGRDDQVNQVHFLLPKHPARILICGSSGSGKSNLLINMLQKQLVYDRIYVFSRHINQPKYKFLKEYIEDIEKCMEKKMKVKNYKIIKGWSDKLEEMPSIEDYDEDYRNLIVIDDFNIITKPQQAIINDMYTRVRHRNASIVMLNQMYFRTDRSVRLNLTHCILFQNNNNREITTLGTELGSDLEKGQFKKLYNKVLNKRFNFLVIDNTTFDKKLRYREQWNGLFTEDFNL